MRTAAARVCRTNRLLFSNKSLVPGPALSNNPIVDFINRRVTAMQVIQLADDNDVAAVASSVLERSDLLDVQSAKLLLEKIVTHSSESVTDVEQVYAVAVRTSCAETVREAMRVSQWKFVEPLCRSLLELSGSSERHLRDVLFLVSAKLRTCREDMQMFLTLTALACDCVERLRHTMKSKVALEAAELAAAAIKRAPLNVIVQCGVCLRDSGLLSSGVATALLQANCWQFSSAAELPLFFDCVSAMLSLRCCASHDVSKLSPELRQVLFAPSSSAGVVMIASELRACRFRTAAEFLESLLQQRRSEWKSFPPSLLLLVQELAYATSCFGSVEDIERALHCGTTFVTPGLLLGRIVEASLAGIAERIRLLQNDLTPKESISAVDASLRAVVAFVGVDLNLDLPLAVIDACLRNRRNAVPLASCVVRVFEECGAPGLTPPSPHFYRQYALRNAPMLASVTSSEHLHSVWKSPAVAQNTDMFWVCPVCSKPNSARYGFCTCSALASTRVVCGLCSAEQDSRLPECVTCGASIAAQKNKVTVTQANWACVACSAQNPPHVFDSCIKCGVARKKRSTKRPPCAQCNSVSARPLSVEPFCISCGKRDACFTNETSHFVWFCYACDGYHAATDLVCPSFGNQMLTAATPRRPWHPVTCPQCGTAASSPFAVECKACSCNLRRVGERRESKHALACGGCCALNHGASASDACVGCSTPLGDAEYVPLAAQRCGACHYMPPTGTSSCLSAVCSKCGVLVRGAESCSAFSWSWSHVRATLEAAALWERGDRCAARFLELLEFLATRVIYLEAPSAAVQRQLAPLLAKCQQSFRQSGNLARRRTAALCGKLLFSPVAADKCSECLGTHPSACCSLTPHASWRCDCGEVNKNTALGQYLCLRCLECRPEVKKLVSYDAWACTSCKKPNVDFETYCVYCGTDRDALTLKLSHKIPFVPSCCKECGTVFLQATCPACADAELSHIRAAEGIVSRVSGTYAVIRSRSSPGDHIFVSAGLLQNVGLEVGQEVTYSAVKTREGKLKATFIHCRTR